MGLRTDEHLRSRAGRYVVPALIALLSLGLHAGGEAFRDALQYDRHAIASGEAWRLLSGHFVHLGWPHLLLNIGGLGLVWLLVGSCFGGWQWLAILVVSAAIIDVAFWFLTPELLWYVGLSGILHGMLAGGAIGLISARSMEAGILLAVLSIKLTYEYLLGPLPGSGDSVGGPVITDAHLFGAAGGAVIAILFLAYAHWTNNKE